MIIVADITQDIPDRAYLLSLITVCQTIENSLMILGNSEQHYSRVRLV